MEPEFKKESAEQYDAFKRYYEMGYDRSYSKIAMEFKKSISTVEKWGKAFNWQDRVNRLDAEARNKETERQLIEGEADYIQRNLKITKLGIYKHMEAIKDGRMKYGFKSLVDLMNLEHRLRTGYNDQVDININLSSLSNDELVKRIDDLNANVKKLTSISKFNASSNVEDADYIDIKTNEEK